MQTKPERAGLWPLGLYLSSFPYPDEGQCWDSGPALESVGRAGNAKCCSD